MLSQSSSIPTLNNLIFDQIHLKIMKLDTNCACTLLNTCNSSNSILMVQVTSMNRMEYVWSPECSKSCNLGRGGSMWALVPTHLALYWYHNAQALRALILACIENKVLAINKRFQLSLLLLRVFAASLKQTHFATYMLYVLHLLQCFVL